MTYLFAFKGSCSPVVKLLEFLDHEDTTSSMGQAPDELMAQWAAGGGAQLQELVTEDMLFGFLSCSWVCLPYFFLLPLYEPLLHCVPSAAILGALKQQNQATMV